VWLPVIVRFLCRLAGIDTGRRGALAFATGIGAYGWVGIFFVISAELGGSRMAGLLSGMAFASIVIGLLVGPVTFGLLLVRWDSYTAPWTAFAVLSAVAACATLVISPAIERERR
jgi:MFS family permease